MDSASLTEEEFARLCALVWPSVLQLEETERMNVLRKWCQTPLRFADGPASLGFRQEENGPCGVLAALQAKFLRFFLFGEDGVRRRTKEEIMSPSLEGKSEALGLALADVISRATSETARIVTCDTTLSEAPSFSYAPLTVHNVPQGAVLNFVKDHLEQFQAPGALVLLVYTLVLSRGIDTVRADIKDRDGLVTLIQDQWGFCSQNLVQLFLEGQARDDIDPMSKLLDPLPDDVVPPPAEQNDCGFLTFMEADSSVYGGIGFDVGDHFKRPKFPVWVVHGRDHYTTLFSDDPASMEPDSSDDPASMEAASSYPPPRPEQPFTLYHYNGLPPAGPRLAAMSVSHGVADNTRAQRTLKRDISMLIRRKESDGSGYVYEVALNRPVEDSVPKVVSSGGDVHATVPPAGERGMCLTGCGFHGNAVTGGMCSKCFKEKKPLMDEGVCINECGFHGSPDWAFMCSKCFKESGAVLPAPSEPIPPPQQDTKEDTGPSTAEVEAPGGSPADGGPYDDAVLEPGEEWRCRECVMNQSYVMNTADVPVCSGCGQDVSACRRTVWVPFDELNPTAQKEAELRYIPPVETVLRTHNAWKDCRIDYGDERPPAI